MPTILLEQIIELLTGWKDSFFTWANAIGDKIASIKTNTDSLPDIKDNTDDIKDNTAAVITPISNINTNVASITSDTASIRTDTAIVKNNAQAIATSSGTTAAFAEDIANNTLEVKNKITTIASDTTQMRADSGAIRADVSEIKDTLGLYLYNTIVTEDAEGSIANFDTDLKDYLQNAVVTIPADGNGISGITLKHCNKNMFDINYLSAPGITINNGTASGNILAFFNAFNRNQGGVKGFRFDADFKYTLSLSAYTNSVESIAIGLIIGFRYTDGTNDVISIYNNVTTATNFSITSNPNKTIQCLQITYNSGASNTWYLSDLQLEVSPSSTSFEDFNGNVNNISFTSPITDGASVDLLSGIVKINTSPVTYDSITPLVIRTFKGVNNIYSDIGDIDVTYRETLKHYLEKQDNNSRSLNRNANLLRENIEASDEDSDRRI